MEDKKKTSTANCFYLKVFVRPDTGPEMCIWSFGWSIYFLPKPHQKWTAWKSGWQEAILKEEKQEEKAELCQLTQEQVLWSDESSPELISQHYLKQCGFILTENVTISSQHPKKSFGMTFKRTGKLFWRIAKWQESLSKRIQAMLKN